jgi:hypothetical protein
MGVSAWWMKTVTKIFVKIAIAAKTEKTLLFT